MERTEKEDEKSKQIYLVTKYAKDEEKRQIWKRGG